MLINAADHVNEGASQVLMMRIIIVRNVVFCGQADMNQSMTGIVYTACCRNIDSVILTDIVEEFVRVAPSHVYVCNPRALIC